MSGPKGKVLDVRHAIESEARTHGDMVMIDFHHTHHYQNLTLKSVLMLKYLMQTGLNSTLYFKANINWYKLLVPANDTLGILSRPMKTSS